MVNQGNHPQMALIQVSELLLFTQIDWTDLYIGGEIHQHSPARLVLWRGPGPI